MGTLDSINCAQIESAYSKAFLAFSGKRLYVTMNSDLVPVPDFCKNSGGGGVNDFSILSEA
jgi:hypothetical protein